MDSSSCPTSPYTSSGSRGSPARFSFGSTDDSSSVSSTGMSPPHLPFLSKRQRYKRAVQSRIRGLVSKPVSVMDFETTFVMNGEELPYVMSVWDPTRPMKFLRPPPDLAYYVPPAVDDGDFFGGQQHMWQTKMVWYIYHNTFIPIYIFILNEIFYFSHILCFSRYSFLRDFNPICGKCKLCQISGVNLLMVGWDSP